MNNFKTKHTTLDGSLLEAANSAFRDYLKKNLTELPEDLSVDQYDKTSAIKYRNVIDGKSLSGEGSAGDKEAKIKMHLKTAGLAAKALIKANADKASISVDDFYAAVDDILVEPLDRDGKKDVDPSHYSIFTDLTQRFEQRFFDDLTDLNVLRPDNLTRVTEYVPQIVKFIEQIEEKGFAYATEEGDVYFDISAFQKAGNDYARLEPWNANNEELQADGEGALINKGSKKRSSGDFALWKKSKDGEPSWPSKWGPGRPGWHIECSVMASDVLETPSTRSIDIHSGGIDLAFPHHDNEIAQSEAYYCEGHGHQQHQWVNYFLHMGHLSISGSKMSKSLKNFTTIREALTRGDWTPRSLRVVFLLGSWKDGIEITDSLVKEGQAWESRMTNLFLKALNRQKNPSDVSNANGTISSETADADTSAAAKLVEAQKGLDEALRDSFDTRKAMQILSTLVTDINTAEMNSRLTDETMLSAARWITQIATIFGLDPHGDLADANRIGWSDVDIPEAAKPFVYPLSAMRDTLRRQARSSTFSPAELSSLLPADVAPSSDAAAQPYAAAFTAARDDVRKLITDSAPAASFLALCDALRDVRLWDLGIYLEDPPADMPGQAALVRPVDPELRRARAEREEQRAQAAEAKARRLEAEAAKQRERDEKAKVDPKTMFRTAEYGAWDDDGLPTKDAKGEEISKAKGKKLRKEWEKQGKLYEGWLKSQGKA